MSTVPVTVFFDFACPFSYVTLEALRRREAAGGVRVTARALQLFPAPEPLRPPAADEPWEARVRPLADELGLPLRVPAFRPRTLKAHEAAAAAAAQGRGPEMRGAIFAAYWGEERDIARIDVLVSLAEAAGVEPERLRIELDIDLHREAVLSDETLADRLRVTTTPTTFVGTGRGAGIHVGVLGEPELTAALADFRG